MTARVKEHMAKDTQLMNADIGVQTNAGVVSLTGEMRGIMTSPQSFGTALQDTRVQSVKSNLTL